MLKDFSVRNRLDDAGFLERGISTVLVNGLDRAGGKLNGDELVQFGHPDAAGLQVDQEFARGVGRDVRADTALFLSQTATMDFMPFGGAATCDAANSGHCISF